MPKDQPSSDEVVTSGGLKLFRLVKNRWQWATLGVMASAIASVVGFLSHVALADRAAILSKVEDITTQQATGERDRDEIKVRLNVIHERLEMLDTKTDRYQLENTHRLDDVMKILIRGR